MFKAEIKKNGKTKVLTLSGPLTIQYAGEIKKTFLEAVSKFKTVRVSFGEVGEVDFSFLQLLQSLKTSVKNKKKSLVFIAPLPPALEKAAQDLGVSLTELCPVPVGD
jgi:ABC-type transporter Mla MlaB component